LRAGPRRSYAFVPAGWVNSGGHSGVTIVPLLSQTEIAKGVTGEAYKALVKRIQFGGDGEFFSCEVT
jgi:hypothetical protein